MTIRGRLAIAGSVLLMGAVLLATEGLVTAGEVRDPPEPAAMDPELAEGVCVSVMTVLSDRAARNEFDLAGLRSDEVPAAALAGLTVGSLTCLDSGTEDRVRAVVVELVGSDGSTAALWLLPHDEEHDLSSWRQYLRDIAQPSWVPATIEQSGEALVALRDAEERARWRIADRQPRVSMWERVRATVAARR